MVGDCADTPPTVVCTAGLDPLRDSGREYAAHLVQLGTETVFLEFPGIVHGFTTLRKAIPSGQKDLEAHDPPEFCDWKWVEAEQLPDLIVPFKKRVYRAVVEAFRELV